MDVHITGRLVLALALLLWGIVIYRNANSDIVQGLGFMVGAAGAMMIGAQVL